MDMHPPKHPLLPELQPTLRVYATQPNANPAGDIFGGWLMSQIDLAASVLAVEYSKGPVATVAVNRLQFVAPIYVGDIVSFYAKITKVGRTSMQIEVEVYAQRAMKYSEECVKVSDSCVTFVATEIPGKSRVLPEQEE